MRMVSVSCNAVLAIRIETTVPAPLTLFRFRTPDQVEWLHPDGTVQRGTLGELVVQTSGARWVLVAPGEMVTLHRVPLPSRKRATWIRAVPYALEDQLVEDIEKLHFAMGNLLEDGGLPVAVIQQAVLRAWLENCAEVGVVPAAVVPDPLLLPWEEGAWSVLLEAERAVVRTSRWQGFATERGMLELLLNQSLAETGDARPRRLRVWGSPPPELAATDLTLHVENSQIEPLAVFATTYHSATVLNLLQGPFSRRAHWGRWLRPWRAAAVLAGLWLLAQGVSRIHEQAWLQNEVVALRTEMARLYQETVPDATRIVNPRAQLEARLREVQPSGTSTGTFLELLHQGGQPLTHFPEVTLRALSYRDGQLSLDLQGGSPAVLDQLQQRLNQQPGLRIEMRTTQRDGQVESKVTLAREAR
jgi:general secretion pathway protein L